MKIVFFGNAPDKNAAIRYRLLAFAKMLETDGHTCVICLPSSTALRDRLFENRPRLAKLLYLTIVLLRRLVQIRHVIGADVVYFRGPVFDYGPPVLESIIRRLNPRLVFDIDDAIWEPAAHVSSPFLRFVDHGWVRKMCGMCAHAVVGNRYLADYVRQFLPRVTIVPTCIDMTKHAQKAYPAGRAPVVLGWTGLKDNLGYLEIIADALRELAARHDIVLEIASGADYHLDGIPVVNRRWVLHDEFDYLQHPDIGLMPLKDTPRARGKCAFKALQYMGVGTPVVLSPVGMNTEVIEDGVTGYFADAPEVWRNRLERLIADPDLRQRMGRAARADVERRFSHKAHYPALKHALESASEHARPQKP